MKFGIVFPSYIDAWKARMGGDPNCGQLGRVMKALEMEHDPQKVLAHWTAYLANPDTPDRVKNPNHFAQKFGLYAPNKRQRTPLVGEFA